MMLKRLTIFFCILHLIPLAFIPQLVGVMIVGMSLSYGSGNVEMGQISLLFLLGMIAMAVLFLVLCIKAMRSSVVSLLTLAIIEAPVAIFFTLLFFGTTFSGEERFMIVTSGLLALLFSSSVTVFYLRAHQLGRENLWLASFGRTISKNTFNSIRIILCGLIITGIIIGWFSTGAQFNSEAIIYFAGLTLLTTIIGLSIMAMRNSKWAMISLFCLDVIIAGVFVCLTLVGMYVEFNGLSMRSSHIQTKQVSVLILFALTAIYSSASARSLFKKIKKIKNQVYLGR